jgi:hypothetical protein
MLFIFSFKHVLREKSFAFGPSIYWVHPTLILVKACVSLPIETSIKLLQGWKIASSSLSGWYVYKVGIASSHMNLVESLLSGWYGYKVGGIASSHMNLVGSSLLSGWYGYKVGGIASSHINLVGSSLSGWYGYKVGGIASSHMNLVGSLLSVLLPSIAGIRSSPVYQTDIHS